METQLDHQINSLAEIQINQRRWLIERHRKHERHQISDCQRFGLGEICKQLDEFENLTEKDVTCLANRIKRRKTADANDLMKLSNAFLRNRLNVTTFVKITGAINILVKELSGKNTTLQRLAAECLCNLALGDEICCEKIVTFAGTYLLAYLHNITGTFLNMTCLWTLQNLIIGGHKAFKILYSQQLIAQIADLTETQFSNELQSESVKTLDIILLEEHNALSDEDKFRILSVVSKKLIENDSAGVIKTIYTAITVAGCKINEHDAVQIIPTVCKKLFIPVDNFNIEILYSLRILANLVAMSSDYMKFLIDYLIVNNLKMSSLFNDLCDFAVEFLAKEMLWLVANIIKSSYGEEYLQYDNLYSCMKLSKKYYF